MKSEITNKLVIKFIKETYPLMDISDENDYLEINVFDLCEFSDWIFNQSKKIQRLEANLDERINDTFIVGKFGVKSIIEVHEKLYVIEYNNGQKAKINTACIVFYAD